MMDEQKRDDHMIEMIDRMARVEMKLDAFLDTKADAEEALSISKDNAQEIKAVRERVDGHDDKWKTDRSEKWGLWIAVVAGVFTIGAAFISTTF